MQFAGKQGKRRLLRHRALIRLDAAHASVARIAEIVKQQLIKAQLGTLPGDIDHILPRQFLFRRQPVRAVCIVPDITRQLADRRIRHMCVGVAAVMQRTDAGDRVIAGIVESLQGIARHAAADHRAAIDRAGNVRIVQDLAGVLLHADGNGVDVRIKSLQRRFPAALQNRGVQLVRIGVLRDRLLHDDLQLRLRGAVLRSPLRHRLIDAVMPRKLKAEAAVGIIHHILLDQHEDHGCRQRQYQQHDQKLFSAAAPVIAFVSARPFHFCHRLTRLPSLLSCLNACGIKRLGFRSVLLCSAHSIL